MGKYDQYKESVFTHEEMQPMIIETDMTDIVERLRDKLPMVHDGEGMIVDDDAVLDTLSKAADEIERLRTENQELKLQYLSDQGQWIEETGRLREALNEIAAWHEGPIGPHMDEPAAASTARLALNKGESHD